MEEEYVDIVDENDNVVRKTTRKEVRQKALLHRDVTVIITNENREFLLQKRSEKKDLYPGFWDLGIGETVKASETYSQAAARGLKEELGIGTSGKNLEMLFQFRFSSPIHNALCTIFHLTYNGKIQLIDGEVIEYKFMNAGNAKKFMEREKFHPVRKRAFEKYLKLKC